ncbi:hypothetical protein [Stutzerimonas kunmingensis]|uniref:hypothetical protein n=1 Tax=Stutzerimonas kunmingensis TaxID=1211807 RepID=UPI0028B1147C|nr:hypothetical protein [Stutzerimonas kunmingensis]
MNQSNPIRWAYPFPGKDSSNNPLQLLTHMAQAKGGFYPTGENGLWHGGVHFDEGTAAAFDQSSVRCIADGEVIAYRIDERYPVSEFTDDIPLVKRAPFSTGFVLVKHSLQPPPLKNADGSIVEGQTPPSLTLYSLYMHLLDWAGYQAQPDLPRPTFWETKRYTVNTQQDGLSVRAGPSKSATKLSELSKGAEITIGETVGEFSKLVSLISGTAQPALAADDKGQLSGYVSLSLLKPHSKPAEYDKVVVLDSGLPIKAGDLIGHPGLYQNLDSAAQHMVHVELFSCDDVPAFITQSRAWASRLTDDQKTLLKVYKGASKLIAHRKGISAENPPKLSDEGTLVGVDLIIPQALLDGLPASHKIQNTFPAGGSTPASTSSWWRLDGLFADANDNAIDGWLAEQELITTRHSPWEWEGFQCIEETGTPVEKLAYAFNARGLLSADEQHNYRAQISKADGGSIVTLARLYDIADTDKDGVLTSAEIQAALARPWHAQVLGQLIARYESEWFWNKGKWDELDPLLAEQPGKPDLVWEVEKQRIEKLSWWNDLAGRYGIPTSGIMWNISPSGLLSSFANRILLVSRATLAYIMNSASDEILDKYLLPINDTLEAFEINTPLRIAHFLSQIGHETGELRYSAELSSGKQYEGRSDLGNTQAGDGHKFKGRGLLQITGRSNYEACETFLKKIQEFEKLDITSSTERAEQLAYNPKLAALASGYYWAKLKPNLNAAADRDDLFLVSVYVNGWAKQDKPFYPNKSKEPNNMHHRAQMLERAKQALGIL